MQNPLSGKLEKIFSLKFQNLCCVMGLGSTELKEGKLPVLDQRYDLRVGLANDALSIHLHYPVPWIK